jgi:hypothetical protein
LPDGDYVTPWHLAKAIALAVVPVPEKDECYWPITEKLIATGPAQFIASKLTEHEQEYLANLWKDLPNTRDSGIPVQGLPLKTDFEPFFKAFKDAPDKPEWSLPETVYSTFTEAEKKRHEAQLKHMGNIDKAVIAGDLTAFDRDFARTRERMDASYITMQDAERYLLANNFAVTHAPPLTESATQPQADAFPFGAPPSLRTIAADGTPTFDSAGYALYLAAKATRNAKGRYTMAEAALLLAKAHNLNPAAFVESRMLPAVDAGLLKVSDPADGGPLRGRKCDVYADEVTPAGVDTWLAADGFAEHVRWPVSAVVETVREPPSPVADTAPTPQAQTTATSRLSTNKAALIAQHKHEWPTIESDLKNASQNGLSKAARAGKRDWFEDSALDWARSKNKLQETDKTTNSVAILTNWTKTTHRLEG